jgi:hypothetical protein
MIEYIPSFSRKGILLPNNRQTMPEVNDMRQNPPSDNTGKKSAPDGADAIPEGNQNQGHNVKKEALGPNTKR